MSDPTKRFSSRVESYARYRPGYPPAVAELLAAECGLTADSVIADVGSGTGLLAVPFLERGLRVVGVEPNREMREAGDRLLAGSPRWSSVGGRAEATGLPGASADLVMAGQAFHWFDRAGARAEFARVLRPGGWAALIWNERLTEGSAFLRDYEQLLRDFATDYAAVDHRNVDRAALAAFFGPAGFRTASFPNAQSFDLEGARGRLLSSSYTPEAGDPRHAPMLERLAEIFARGQEGGRVTFAYETQVHYGRLSDA